MIESEIQRKILSSCSFFEKGAKYSDLRIAELENDLYNYHLQKLVKDGFLLKKVGLYKLTPKGKSLVTNIDEIDLKMPATYKVSVYLCPVMDGKILLTRRQKHPQFGYVGLVAEKKKYGEELIVTAKRALAEETGMTAENLRIIGNLHQVRKNKEGEVIEDGVFYVCYTDKVAGELREKSVEGEYFWIDLDKVSTIEKIFKPSLEVIVDEVQKRLNGEKSFDDMFIYEFLPEPEEY